MRSFRAKQQAPAVDRHAAAADHVVHFYDETEALLQGAASFLAGGLLRGAPALVIALPERVAGLKERLAQMGVDVARAASARQLVVLDSETTLSRLLTDGMPDERRFGEVIGGEVASMTEIWRPFQLFAFGDMVDVLSLRGQGTAAVELERLWDELARRHGFALYCAYHARGFASEADRATYHAICGHHGAIVPMSAVLPEPSAAPELPA